MKPRITLVTLGVDDLERSVNFYRDGLGLKTQGIVGTQFEHGAVVFFDLQPGLKLALWPRASLAADCGLAPGAASPTDFGVKRPSLSIWWARPVDMTFIFSPTRRVPLTTRTSDTSRRIACSTTSEVRLGERLGRLERSCRGSPRRRRLTHLEAVCREQPTTSAAAVIVSPAATRSQTRARCRTVKTAFA